MWPFQAVPSPGCTLTDWTAFLPVLLAAGGTAAAGITGFYFTVGKPALEQIKSLIRANTSVTVETKQAVDANTADRQIKSDVSNEQLAAIATKVEAPVTVPESSSTMGLTPAQLATIVAALRATPPPPPALLEPQP